MEEQTEYFRENEFKCKCKRTNCDAKPMLLSFLQKLENLRKMWGKPLIPSSGERCKIHNQEVGGKPDSQHLLGNAADFYMADTKEVKALMELAEKAGFNGIGYGRRLIHIDDRKKYARWVYDK